MSDDLSYVAPDIPGSDRARQWPGYEIVRVVRGDRVVAEWPGHVRSQDHPKLPRTKPGRAAKMRRRLALRDGIRCYLCGDESVPLRDLRIEHKLPRSRGGSSKPENLGLACVPCDVAKSDMTPEEFWLTRSHVV